MGPAADVEVGALPAHDGTIAALETSNLLSAGADAIALAGCLAANLMFAGPAGPTCGKQSPLQDGVDRSAALVQLVCAVMKRDSYQTFKA